MMRSDGLFEFLSNNHARPFCGRPTSKEHYSCTRILEGTLEQSYGHGQGRSRTSCCSLVIINRPGILLQLLQSICELEFALLYWQEEASGSSHRTRSATRLLLRHSRPYPLWCQTKHLLDLLCTVFFASTEDIGLCTFCVANLVYLGHCSVGYESHKRVGRE